MVCNKLIKYTIFDVCNLSVRLVGKLTSDLDLPGWAILL